MTIRMALIFLLLPVPLAAQSITSYTLTLYQSGTQTLVGTPTVIPVAAVICNQTPPTATSTVNPDKVVFTDTVNVGKACIYLDPGTGPLKTLPFGPSAYEGTLKATNSAATSAESARSLPFTHPGTAPPVPINVQVVQ